MQILRYVKMLLKLGDDVQYDDLLLLYIDIITQRILDYCNLSALPTALELTLAQMVADEYTLQNSQSEVSLVNVSAVSEGGRTVSFGTNFANALISSADERISKAKVLNKYKRLYKG